MRKLILFASAAAMAVATPLVAQGRGGGHGGGNGKGPGGAIPHSEARGAGHGQGPGHAPSAAQPHQQRVDRVERGGGHGPGHGNSDVRRVEAREIGHGGRGEVREIRGGGDRDWGGWLSRGHGADGGRDRFTFLRDGRPLPVRVGQGGCPPGLAKHNAFCMPPGQLRHAQRVGQRIERSRFGPVPQEWLYRFRDDGDFYYLYGGDRDVYRINRRDDLISSIIPLLSSGLGVGQPLPLGYEVYNVPYAYRDDFVDSDDWLYRYDDNAIYRVDSGSGLIDGVVALLTGNGLDVGSRLPDGYDAYNLPTDYRDRYADDADSMYRYANGGIYEVDPTTMIVRAVVDTIT